MKKAVYFTLAKYYKVIVEVPEDSDADDAFEAAMEVWDDDASYNEEVLSDYEVLTVVEDF